MGQKVNPIGLRLGINRTWDSRWFADGGEYGRLLHEDIKIREYLKEQLKQAGVSQHRHRAPAQEVPRHDPCRAPRRDHRQEGRRHREAAQGRLGDDRRREVHLNIVEIRKPETDAQLVAENIAQQLERRVAFRRAMKRAMQSAMRLGAAGHPHQLRPAASAAPKSRAWNGTAKAACRCTRCAPTSTTASPRPRPTYGIIGVKVWIFKGEMLEHDPMAQDKRLAAKRPGEGGRAAARRRPRPRRDAQRKQKARIDHAATETDQVPQAVQGPHPRRRQGRHALNFGSYGLKAMEPERITARQIEAAAARSPAR